MQADFLKIFLALVALLLTLQTDSAYGYENEVCLGCHEDTELEAVDGHLVGVNAEGFDSSVHSFLSCTDCHTQPADYDDIPHFQVYRKVQCQDCHEDATSSFMESFHGLALKKGVREAPDCIECHSSHGDPHQIFSLNSLSAETACYQCHAKETDQYDGSVHAVAAKKGKNSPGCIGCHPTHSQAFPPSAGAVNSLCVNCHTGAMEHVKMGGHAIGEDFSGVTSCASCHDVHATHKPHLDEGTIQSCQNCHDGYHEKFKGSVHEDLLNKGEMNCLSCHRSHQMTDAVDSEVFGCGRCHENVEKHYRTSAHRLARLRGDEIAATCGDCHEGHHVLSASDPNSMVNHQNIPNTCGNCHTDQAVITSDYVRLPISLPSYTASIHGQGWQEDKPTAVCTDCHGSHDLQSASSPTSKIHKQNIASVCGNCHEKVSDEYLNSIHGRAVAHGITDSPSCTDCHDEHLIYGVADPRSAVNPQNEVTQTCAECHEDPEMAVRYGLPAEVIESYQDSYHGWAIKRGGKAVATCTDCHNKHEIKSLLDSTSSIHKDNVVATCGRCHPNSNPKFAASYSHILARDKMMVHDWVRIAYIILITVVLGGMFLHNLIIYIHDLRIDYLKKKNKPAIRRMTRNEITQHLILAITFTGLAVSGFALRFPDAWWVRILTELQYTEELRRLSHRVLAVGLVGASVYHMIYLSFYRKGRIHLNALLPRFSDFRDFFVNMRYHFGRGERPGFDKYDYMQKAEYWALIWGTALMSITGYVLWFPTIATSWLPAWVVRVCEVIHFYEAILAVAAIIIWHFFFVIFLPREYPMNWIWINGRMPVEDWKHHHTREAEELEKEEEII